MANATNTHSTLDFSNGTTNRTSTAISTNILIMVDKSPVGAVQTLQISENRTIKMIDEIGTDGHIDSVPSASTKITGTCTRVRFDRLRITEAFGRGFIHNASQAYPFDIVIIDKQKRAQASQISTVIKNVWINKIEYTYQVNDWVIMENMGWEAETIYSHLNQGSGVNVAQGGEINLPFSNIDIERETDTGKGGRRGSMDAAGLIDLGDSGILF
ncbi:hypothetical protein UFOVP1290_14 [uncultured Caudovirales phage]|uniref:Uncharacterized protein n=1 Tax=uncultured Caudovirales phage TaxID=2100421 RepID=A0A6J5RWX7_9CAUD|nr:hypothetical protein UFOVP1290_14 [uncultured Caudovirales phage]